jgi:hypothetical protein
MSDGFAIGAALGTPTIFDCPSCRETIDATAETCRFCGVKVDQGAALKAAAVLAKVNQACSDASYMKSTALAIPVFIGLRFVPFFSSVGAIGFLGLTVGIPIWALVWSAKYRGIGAGDAEFLAARRTVKIVGLVVTALLLLDVLLLIVLITAGPSRG